MTFDKIYQYNFPTTIRFGAGSTKELGDYLIKNNLSRPLLVTDPTVAELGFFKEITAQLKKKNLSVEIFSDIHKNPVKSDVYKGFKAMVINHMIVLTGMITVGLSTLAFENKLISAPTWMVMVGMGLYFGYIQFNSIFFDRLIATFKYVSTVGFLIYLADSLGYVGSISVLLFKEFGNTQLSWLDFFISSGYILSVAGSLLITASLIYFISKFRHWKIQ